MKFMDAIAMAAQKPQEQSSGGHACMHCMGKGRVPARNRGGRGGNMKRTKVCAYCRGTGKSNGGYLTK